MQPARTTVLLPCHSMEDFPTWLDGDEARDLLDAWTAAWHPSLIAATFSVPDWVSIDRPPESPEGGIFIVPAAFDDRLGHGFESSAGGCVVRKTRGREAIVRAAAAGIGGAGATAAVEAGPLVADFHALGLARLLSELLALRMRSSLGGDVEAFDASAVAAAQAAVAGDEAAARERLAECFETLAGIRRRYYPVEIWMVDLVLLAGSTLGPPLDDELAAPGGRTILATGELVEALARSGPERAESIRRRLQAGDLSLACGLWDDAPIHSMTPEAILESLGRTRDACLAGFGAAPATFARRTGGFSAILPQLLEATGHASAVYHLFDGTTLPDAGTGRIRWEGPSAAAIEAVAVRPVDARKPHEALALADAIGDTLDHAHTAIVAFAHYPGTAEAWFLDFRRIHAWSDVFGRFATVDAVVRETPGAGVRADFEPDAFRDRLPRAGDAGSGDVIAESVAAATATARTIRENEARRDAIVSSGMTDTTAASPLPAPPQRPTARTTSVGQRGGRPLGGLSWLGRLFGTRSGKAETEAAILDNGLIAVRIHPETGGIISFRRSGGGPNRLSQQIAVRSTRPPVAGARHEDPLERADYSTMLADTIERIERAGQIEAREGIDRIEKIEGLEGFESRGQLMRDAATLGSFRQRVWLLPGRPIAVVEMAIDLERPLPSPAAQAGWFDHYAACRFAWNENDDLELFRSLHTQSVATDRSTFFADGFVELRGGPEPCTILTLGLPWHVRSSPHMLDCLVASPGQSSATRRLAIGLGLAAPWEEAIDLVAPSSSARRPAITLSREARITGGEPVVEGGRTVGLRIGVLEPKGEAGLVRLSTAIPVAEAWRTDALHRRGRPLAIEEGCVTIDLGRYEWAAVELRFAEGDPR